MFLLKNYDTNVVIKISCVPMNTETYFSQPHGTVKHCISKIISSIFSTWSKSVRTFIVFFSLGEFHIHWCFGFSLISSAVAL